jgi:hypothetical protein
MSHLSTLKNTGLLNHPKGEQASLFETPPWKRVQLRDVAGELRETIEAAQNRRELDRAANELKAAFELHQISKSEFSDLAQVGARLRKTLPPGEPYVSVAHVVKGPLVGEDRCGACGSRDLYWAQDAEQWRCKNCDGTRLE